MQLNRVYNADSDILLKEMLSRELKVDLILTDPPYNLNKDFGNSSDNLLFVKFS